MQAYTDDGNNKQQPIMIHRAIFGSIERFFGILIENCAGAFPLWLAPVQCRIMPVTDAVLEYAQDVVAQMREAGIRVQLDSGGLMSPCMHQLQFTAAAVLLISYHAVTCDTMLYHTAPHHTTTCAHGHSTALHSTR